MEKIRKPEEKSSEIRKRAELREERLRRYAESMEHRKAVLEELGEKPKIRWKEDLYAPIAKAFAEGNAANKRMFAGIISHIRNHKEEYKHMSTDEKIEETDMYKGLSVGIAVSASFMAVFESLLILQYPPQAGFVVPEGLGVIAILAAARAYLYHRELKRLERIKESEKKNK